MSNGNSKIEWSSLWKKEDWWACWIGWFILILAIIGLHEVSAGKWAVSAILPAGPKLGKGWTSWSTAFPKGIGTLGSTIWLFVFMTVVTMIGGAFMKLDLKRYLPGFIVIFFVFFTPSSQSFLDA